MLNKFCHYWKRSLPFGVILLNGLKKKCIYSSQMNAKFDYLEPLTVESANCCTFRQCLSVIFAVFSLLFIAFVGCSSDNGMPVQGGSNELRYDSSQEFWLANHACNEYTDGMKAYVQDVYPYTCVRHNNEWLWTKVCEHNGIVHIDGESWFEGENCSKMMYHCDEGSLREYLGHSPDCGYDWSSNSTNQGVSSSSQTGPVGYTGSYGTLIDSRDGQSYKTVTIGTQTWMAENLNYHDSRLSDDDGGDSYIGANHRYIGANHRYTWAEAVDIAGLFSGSPITCNDNASGRDNESRCSMPEKVRGVCPTGWHLPSRGEWIEMFFVATGVKINDDGKYFQISDEKTKVLRSASGWEACPGASTCRVVNGVGDILTVNGIVINEDQLNRKNGTDLYGLSFYPDIYVDGVTADRYVAYLWVPESRYFYNEITYDAVVIVIKGYYDSLNVDDGFSLTNVSDGYLSVSRGSVRCVKD